MKNLILTLDPLIMDPDDQLIPLESGAMTQAPLVPNPKTEPKRHVCTRECLRWEVPNPKAKPKHHVCVVECPP